MVMRYLCYLVVFMFAVSGIAVAADVVAPEAGLFESIFAIISMLLQGKPGPAAIGLALSQILLLVLKAGLLDKAVGALKYTIIAAVAVLVPGLSLYVADPSLSIAQLLSDSVVLGALQVFFNQAWKYYVEKKA